MENIFYNVFLKYKNSISDVNNIQLFIETGTHLGQTAKFWSKYFIKVDTVELIKNGRCHYGEIDLYKEHEKILLECKNINFIYNDSSKVLKELASKERAVILLDAHNGSESPIYEELKAIKESGINNHVIIIDNTPDFNMSLIIALLKQINNNYIITNSQLGRQIFICYT